MKKRTRRILLTMVALVISVCPILNAYTPVLASDTTVNEQLQDFPQTEYEKTQEKLMAKELAFGSEWVAIGLSRSGEKISNSYYAILLNKLNEELSVGNCAKIVLALSAMGKDVPQSAISILTDIEAVKKEYITTVAYAFIALDAVKYSNSTVKGELITLMSEELKKDSTYSWGVDSAAMVIQALAPYYRDPEVKETIDYALSKIEDAGEDQSACSCAQIICAYLELGLIDKAKPYVTKMMTFYTEDGFLGYFGDPDDMATEQAFYALVAYKRLLNNENSLFNMSDAKYSYENNVLYSPFNSTVAVITFNITNNVASDITITNVKLNRGNNTLENNKERIMVWDSMANMIPLLKVTK